MTRPSAVLVGASGSGTSEIGEQLAQRCQVAFADIDIACSKLYGQSLEDIVITEAPVTVQEAIETGSKWLLQQPGFVALPPSAGRNDAVLAALQVKSTPVVLLTAPLDELARRAGLNVPRPVGLGQIRALFAQMAKEVEQNYRRLDPIIITEALNRPEQAIDEILTAIALQ